MTTALSCIRDEFGMGVTIALCCHNSSRRLVETIPRLARQIVPPHIGWELLLIDNASTDDTAAVASQAWPEQSGIPLRIVFEPRLGLSYARHRAFNEATYDVVSFVDDDNWVAPDWVERAFNIMSANRRVGVCGGHITARFQSDPPWWFDEYKWAYAVSSEIGKPRDVTDTWGALYGAGLTVRKEAWVQVLTLGFVSLLVGRSGEKLSAGEDSEICCALRLAGWRLYYHPGLHMQHCIYEDRLSWTYLCGLFRGFGGAAPFLELYSRARLFVTCT